MCAPEDNRTEPGSAGAAKNSGKSARNRAMAAMTNSVAPAMVPDSAVYASSSSMPTRVTVNAAGMVRCDSLTTVHTARWCRPSQCMDSSSVPPESSARRAAASRATSARLITVLPSVRSCTVSIPSCSASSRAGSVMTSSDSSGARVAAGVATAAGADRAPSPNRPITVPHGYSAPAGTIRCSVPPTGTIRSSLALDVSSTATAASSGTTAPSSNSHSTNK